MPRKSLMAKDPERGERFREICGLLFPGLNRSEVAEKLGGVSPGTLRNWEAGQGLSRSIMTRLERLGVSLDYLMRGAGRPLAESGGAEAKQASPSAGLSPAEALAANMRHLRKERFRGWGGQRRFAEFLGISPNDLCVYEYGRALPNEQRLEDMAARLEIAPEALLRLLPGVEAAPPSPRGVVEAPEARDGAELPSGEEERMRREIVRLETMNEVLRGEIAARETRIRELEETNLALRGLLYSEDTPGGAERRRRLLEKLESPLAGTVGGQNIF